MSGCKTLLACLLLGSLGASEAGQPIDRFATLPDHDNVRISPDGRYVAAKKLGNDGRYGVIVYDLEQLGKKPPLFVQSDDWDTNWVMWKGSDRLLVSARSGSIRTAMDGMSYRMVAMDPDGSDIQRIAELKQSEKQRLSYVFRLDRVIDVMPDDPRRVLMAFNPDQPWRPRLYAVDVYNDMRTLVERGNDSTQWWLRDQAGVVRIAAGVSNQFEGPPGTRTFARSSATGEWRKIWDEDEKRLVFDPILFDERDPDLLYALSEHETGRLGLYRYRLSTGEFVEQVFLHPEVDVSSIRLDPSRSSIEAVEYATDIPRIEWFSSTGAAIQKGIAAALPGWITRVTSRSDDWGRLIVYATAIDHSPRYYLFERATGSARYLAAAVPALDKLDLARTMAVVIAARDQQRLPAYLTLPVGTGNPTATPLPLVVLPHNPPVLSGERDWSSYDPLVHALADRGYAVLQVNFRGSAGYGKAFREAGFGKWGDQIPADIADATNWAIAAKVADPRRVCIVGMSFAGYTALIGTIANPGLYRCAVSVNGISDLSDFLATYRRYGSSSLFSRAIGRLKADGDVLARNSPARRVAEVSAPVLLMHGSLDRTVRTTQSRDMARALSGAGKSVRYIELEGEEHELTRTDTRLQAFREIDAFLAEHLRQPP